MPTKKKTTGKTDTDNKMEREAVAKDVFGSDRDYVYAVGRRKSATATVRLYESGKGRIIVNQLDWKKYFPGDLQQMQVLAPLEATGRIKDVDISIVVRGGGVMSQTEASRHGITRALLKLEPETRGALKPLDLITRDPRKKERKKPGLKRARRAPQWSKR